ncbi:MAG: radical SAM protein [Clostridia bacterium]|nr:radical SAM protein [Clostridia bacterium]
MTQLGVHAVRLTGGEPMARKGCLDLVEQLNSLPGIDYIAMTTNGILLKDCMEEAAKRGLNAVNISLDTLDACNFSRLTRNGHVEDVLKAVHEAVRCGLKVKINAVPVRDFNEEGLVAVAALAKDLPVDVRFIELMPVGCGAELRPIPMDEVRQRLEDAFGTMMTDETRHGYGPAGYMKPQGFKGSLGLIGAVSHEFCDRCNRVRITPEGILKLCLNHSAGLDLRALLRSGASDEEIADKMRDAILHKPVHHGFSEAVEDREQRRMNQIGG